ncbi:hypothetical protein GXM_04741 [Nostoc sphaeroides CCNUC1]|uniref:Uncharacterized protein n=1 Tax=Nostoc sphaeroides CCNUC1 TaxID=2653204 RepID=A0A5P8W438_9NOSO|nr:hypothetical protein GXM_04741 [Nostoc sphaeroides CCNUC1]
MAVTAGNQQGRTTGNKETATSGATKPNKRWAEHNSGDNLTNY